MLQLIVSLVRVDSTRVVVGAERGIRAGDSNLFAEDL